MKRHATGWIVVAAAICISAANTPPAAACTGIRIEPKDGSVIVARTLEFAADLQTSIIVIPRAMELTGTAPGDKPGLRWKSKYGIVGANMFGLPAILDGFNEKGLAVAIFYFPGYAKYQETTDADIGKTIAPWELPVYLLGNCADVDDAVKALQNIRVGDVFQKNMGETPQLHYLVTDARGRSAVVEYVADGLKVHDNPLGVLTNAPTFDWHVTNLCNYINLSDENVPPKDVAGIRLHSLGQGSGMLGLPGDFTPPSRFVRAVACSQSAIPVATAHEGVLQAFCLLNQFDIPKGEARGVENGRPSTDYTQWTGASDLKNHRYYFRTYDNSRIRMIDLDRVNLDAKTIKTVSMAGPEVIEDLTGQVGR